VLDDQTELCMFMPQHDTEVLQTIWGWWVKISCFMFGKLELVYQSTDFREYRYQCPAYLLWNCRRGYVVVLVSDSFGI
jgi:hypothetical protein